MNVELRLFASLSRFLPEKTTDKSCVMETEEKATVRQLLERLDVPLDSVKIIFVNGVRSNLTSVLADGDRVGVFPPVAGG